MKDRITITIDKELLKWLDAKVAVKIFATRSHGLEVLIRTRTTDISTDHSRSEESEK